MIFASCLPTLHKPGTSSSLTGNGHQQFAKIAWKESPVRDDDVPGLWRVGRQDTVYRTTIVSISDLSPPFTTAVDLDENLWVLDFNRKYVTIVE